MPPSSWSARVVARRCFSRLADTDASVLGIQNPNPSRTEVKAAWHAFAKEWHPDLHPEGPEREAAEEKFKRAQAAYAALVDGHGRGSAVPRPGMSGMDGVHPSASYVRRRRPNPYADENYDKTYGNAAYDKNAGTKISIGLTLFTCFTVWAYFGGACLILTTTAAASSPSQQSRTVSNTRSGITPHAASAGMNRLHLRRRLDDVRVLEVHVFAAPSPECTLSHQGL
eukprot:CAMPEP_0206043962 /NCGR_PEP_ID=MMETSP1466-20131121/11041_1 /ASSEMBLY_ACC=CAM_ASM_001126 /TAXON_ID=44452 /ORGANISM="Pavlova gyrans, Strain CCMP608" /LENGTH=225 /DNA_ID=CAMNT_0053418833 /DNA_START=6 /DNA_END=680 /DNA_ORIENTATION=+